MVNTTASATSPERAPQKKLLGRKTGYCNSPSTIDPDASHQRCDGIWNERENEIYYCPCSCHEEKSKKLANAKKYQRNIKKKTEKITECPEHPSYKGIRRPRKECTICWRLYYSNNQDKILQ